MRKKFVTGIMSVMMIALLAGCGNSAETASTEATEATTEATEEVTEAETELEDVIAEEASAEDASSGDAWAYGEYIYTGDDMIYYAITNYMCEELDKNYDTADVGIPTIIEVNRDESNPDDIKVWGCFWYDKYNLVGDTLEDQAGGSYPGCMHVKTTDAGCGYVVESFDVVADGSDFDTSAKEIFGDKYDAFIEAYSNDKLRDEKRKEFVEAYVSAHNVPATKFQDYGQEPIELEVTSTESEEVVYMGGLFANDGKSDINLALFKSAGNPVIIVQEGANIYYGTYETEDAKTDDGKEYTKVTVEGKVYGYHFDEDDETSGFVVDQDGVAHRAIILDESVANDMMNETK